MAVSVSTEKNEGGISWRKATASASNGCVEVAPDSQGVAVRDSKNPNGPILFYTRHEWSAFLDGAKKGEFDHLADPNAVEG